MSRYSTNLAQLEARVIGCFLDADGSFSLADDVGQLVVPETEIVARRNAPGLIWTGLPDRPLWNATITTYGTILKRRRWYPDRVVHLRDGSLTRFCKALADDPRLNGHGLE